MSLKNRFYRTLIRVERIDKNFVEAFITGWRKSNQLVCFSASLIPQSILQNVQSGTCLFAKVNIGVMMPEHLLFTDFEIAPIPDEDDGLG